VGTSANSCHRRAVCSRHHATTQGLPPLYVLYLRVLRYRVCLGIPANCVLQRRAEPRRKQLRRPLSPHPIPPTLLYQLPPSRPQLAAPAPHLLRGGHTAEGTKLRFVITYVADTWSSPGGLSAGDSFSTTTVIARPADSQTIQSIGTRYRLMYWTK